MEKEQMLCGLCKKEVHPLDAHTGRINGKLDVSHIGCWNEYHKRQQGMLGPEYQLVKANLDAQMESSRNRGDA